MSVTERGSMNGSTKNNLMKIYYVAAIRGNGIGKGRTRQRGPILRHDPRAIETALTQIRRARLPPTIARSHPKGPAAG